ncbi:MAG: right-handed parallel beta-helix repeat-containing protein, partial [Verrucomicrobiota bacterium]
MICASLFSLSSASYGTEWFVSEKGNDTWTGTRADAVSGQTDGPFATLQRARDAIRSARAAGDLTPQKVHVREGTYFLKEAFRLEAQDSGSPDAPVIWRAYKDERPVISGAMKIQGWTPWKGEVLQAPLGEASKLKGGVRQVLLGGKRQTLARYPNADPSDPVAGGWAFAAGQGWPMYADKPGEDKHTLEVKEADLRQWANPEEVELTVFARYNWWNDRVRLTSVDVGSRKITLSKDCSYAIRLGDRYFFQNALEELDAPGEWYADNKAGTLYFWPPAGMKAEDASVVVSRALLRLEPGTHDIVWRGFTLEGCEEMAVTLAETERCTFEYNWIRAAGEWNGGGVSVSKGTDNRIRYNQIEYVGNTGIALRGGDVKTLTPAGHIAEHNHIHHFGIYYKQGSAVCSKFRSDEC